MSWWNGNIDTARESKSGEKPVEGKDGNRYYKNGTYGQNDFTVRPREDGRFDVYIESDSKKRHSHDEIDKNGNITGKYHDYLYDALSMFTREELEAIMTLTNNELVAQISCELMSNALILK